MDCCRNFNSVKSLLILRNESLKFIVFMEYIRIGYSLIKNFFNVLDVWLLAYIFSFSVWLITTLFPRLILNIIRKGAAIIFGFVTLFKGIFYSFQISLLFDYKFGWFNFLLNLFIDRSTECLFCFRWGFFFAILFSLGAFIVIYEIRHW